ncbi:hypothetical protein V1514DRAFT_352323 [Lipomyces japonicus]|uniref:uncharacterized protein n=1 Tax=Lipomyces japonicus TaxID=56871 RepID=UPI0034CDEB91
MKKRVSENQITKDNHDRDREFDDDDDRHGPTEVPEEATADVLAKRKIARPRSRRTNGTGSNIGSGSQFSFGSPSPDLQAVKSNPFASFSSNAGTAASPSLGPVTTPVASSAVKPFSFLQTQSTTTTTVPVLSSTTSKPSFGFGQASSSTPISSFATTTTTNNTTAADSFKPTAFNFANSKIQSPVIATSQITNTSKAADDDEGTFVSAGPPAEFVKFLKIRALNEKFAQSITEAVTKDKLSDLSGIAKAYVKFLDQIRSESNPPTTTSVPAPAAVTAVVPASEANLAQTSLTPASAANTPSFPGFSFSKSATTPAPSPVKPATGFQFSNLSSAQQPKLGATQPDAFNSTAETAKRNEEQTKQESQPENASDHDDSDNNNDSDDSDDDIKIQGPSFNITAQLQSANKDTPFSFGNAQSSPASSNLQGPSFKINSTVTKPSSSVFKFNGPAVELTDEKKQNQLEEKLKEAKPLEVSPATSTGVPKFSFGLSSSSSTPAPFDLKDESKSAVSSFAFNAKPFSFTSPAAEVSSQPDQSEEKLKITTPPVNATTSVNDSPFKISSLGSNAPSAGGLFNFAAPKPAASSEATAISPFKFNVPASTNNDDKAESQKEKKEEEKITEAPATPSKPVGFSFGQAKSSNGSTPVFNFGANSGSAAITNTVSDNASTSSPFGNNTWTPDKGIKFGDEKAAKSGDDKTPAAKPTIGSFTFNNPLRTTPTGTTAPSTTTPTATSGSPFGASVPAFGASFKPSVGFSFGSSPSAAGTTATNNSNTSFAPPVAVPGTAGDEDGDAAPAEPQVDLAAEKGPGEEDEEVEFEHRGRVYSFNDIKFESVGLGPVRVLKHNTTGKARVLVRADGSGRIVLNVGLRKNVSYVMHDKNVVRVVDFVDGGKGVTYLIKIKTKEDAEKLRDVLEKLKTAA